MLGALGTLLVLAPIALVPSCTPPEGQPYSAPLPVPFTVSDYFSPTGYMGDGATIGVVNMVAAVCPSRPANAQGDCYTVTYTPPVPRAQGFAGVYWQYPGNNWGGYEGHQVSAGATKLTLQAMGSRGGEPVSFKAGGIATTDNTVEHHDTLDASGPTEMLTTQWAQYEVDFNGQGYGDEVLGAFAWLLSLPEPTGTAADKEPIVFYLDDIRWTQ